MEKQNFIKKISRPNFFRPRILCLGLWFLSLSDSAQENTRSFAVLSEPESSAEWIGQNYALLIGISDYDHWKDLNKPVADIEAIRDVLEEVYGFEVDCLIDPTREEILLKLRQYHDTSKYKPADQLLIFFAGHGTFDETSKMGYLVANDTKTRKADPAFSTYLDYPLRLIDNMPIDHILLIVDACFAGALDPKIAFRGDDIEMYRIRTQYIRRKMKLRTRRYITSGGKEYVPDDSQLVHALLKGFNSVGGSDDILTLDRLIGNYLDGVDPLPRWNEFGSNEPGSTFLFINRGRQLVPEEIVLPEGIARAASYCSIGGPANVEKGVQTFRGIIENLPPEVLTRLDSDLKKRAEAEYQRGSIINTCWIYQALFRDFYSPITPIN